MGGSKSKGMKKPEKEEGEEPKKKEAGKFTIIPGGEKGKVIPFTLTIHNGPPTWTNRLEEEIGLWSQCLASVLVFCGGSHPYLHRSQVPCESQWKLTGSAWMVQGGGCEKKRGLEGDEVLVHGGPENWRGGKNTRADHQKMTGWA